MSEENGEQKPVRLSKKRKQLIVEVEQLDGSVVNYFLREMEGSDRDAHNNFVNQRAKFSRKGTPQGMRDHTGVIEDLLSRSLFKPDGTPVTASELKKEWPCSAQMELYDMALRLSGMHAEAREEAKND